MRPSRLLLAALGVALGWGVGAGPSRADGPYVGQPPVPLGVGQAPAPGNGGPWRTPVRDALDRAHGAPAYPRIHPAAQELPPGYPPVNNTPSRTPLRAWLHNHRPLCCWASFNGYGCSSAHSELAFVFGSCRTFYGEPCLKGPPPSPLPPWAVHPPGVPGGPPLGPGGAPVGPDGAPLAAGVAAQQRRCACP